MIKKRNRIQNLLCLDCLKLVMGVILITIICISCGGGGGDPVPIPPTQSPKEGVFLDSAVEGIGYNTDTKNGLTDSDGTFTYQEGEIIKFTIGDILIGQALAKEILTPIDLVEGANDETNPTVTNICRFLQTLDNDNNLDNGISIIEAVRNAAKGEAINFDVNQIEFENDQNVQQTVNTLLH